VRGTCRAYVADFGLARALSDGPHPDGGRTFGTCHYASPEQAAGLPTDHRSDIYALGVVGYVMATGRSLFTGSPREILE
jgi:serine/threonine-protein kinase